MQSYYMLFGVVYRDTAFPVLKIQEMVEFPPGSSLGSVDNATIQGLGTFFFNADTSTFDLEPSRPYPRNVYNFELLVRVYDDRTRCNTDVALRNGPCYVDLTVTADMQFDEDLNCPSSYFVSGLSESSIEWQMDQKGQDFTFTPNYPSGSVFHYGATTVSYMWDDRETTSPFQTAESSVGCRFTVSKNYLSSFNGT
jgi:hypothetical protein